MTNKKGNKQGYKRKQKGDKADTVTNKKGDKGRKGERADVSSAGTEPGKQQ